MNGLNDGLFKSETLQSLGAAASMPQQWDKNVKSFIQSHCLVSDCMVIQRLSWQPERCTTPRHLSLCDLCAVSLLLSGNTHLAATKATFE